MGNWDKYPHGYFADPDTSFPIAGPAIHATWCINGTRDMVLDQPVMYVDPRSRRHFVPDGFRVNGLSVPRPCWRLVMPYEGLSRDASVIHDWLCSEGHDWSDAAWVFYHAMRCRGVKPFSAWVRWFAVRWVGVWFCRWHRGAL